MFGIKFTKRILTGLGLIYVAGLGWLAEIIIPFTQLPHKVFIFTLVIVASEVIFFLGIAIIGKPLYLELKSKLSNYIKNRGRTRE